LAIVTDNDDELGWSDPAVVLGAIALVAVIVWVLISVVTGHNPLQGDGHSRPPPTSRRFIPSESATMTSVDRSGKPYPNCAAAARDGRYNIQIY